MLSGASRDEVNNSSLAALRLALSAHSKEVVGSIPSFSVESLHVLLGSLWIQSRFSAAFRSLNMPVSLLG